MKEPHFFAEDFGLYRNVQTESNYRHIYRKAEPNQLCGDASVFYLYSDVALDAIKAHNPDAKFLVCLRNPTQMARSLHTQRLVSRFETEPHFWRAWLLQEQRRRGEKVPVFCPVPKFLDYEACCRQATQLEALYGRFPADNIKCMFLDDFRDDMREAYRQALLFLGLPDDRRREFRPVNEATVYRNNFLSRHLRANTPLKRLVKSGIRRLFPDLPMGFAARFAGASPPLARKALPHAIRRILCDVFRGEVVRLEKITGRDLKEWREYEPLPNWDKSKSVQQWKALEQTSQLVLIDTLYFEGQAIFRETIQELFQNITLDEMDDLECYIMLFHYPMCDGIEAAGGIPHADQRAMGH